VPAWVVLFIGMALVADIPLHAHPWLDQRSAFTATGVVDIDCGYRVASG